MFERDHFIDECKQAVAEDDSHKAVRGAIPVRGGQFFDTPRSEWDHETLLQGPCDVEKDMRLFQESIARLNAA